MSSQDLVGQRIKTVRRQRGLSQAQLAHPELSDSYVSLIESGKRTPTPAVLELLAAKLECSLTYLLNGVTAEQMEEIEVGLRFARLALENGEVEEARARFAELRADPSLAGLAQLRLDAEYGYALAAEACGDLEEAIEVHVRLLESEDLATERRIAISLALCRCYRQQGDLTAAVRVGERMLGREDRPSWSDELVELGATLLLAYIERGDLLRARQFSGELLAAAEQLGTPRATVAACWNAAIVAEQTRRGDEALALAERALAIHSENGDARNLARVRGAYAYLLLRIRPEEAETCRDLLVRAKAELNETSASITDRALCNVYLAKAELALGNNEKAAEYAIEALGKLKENARGPRAEARLVLGHAYLRLGRDDAAASELSAAAEWLGQAPVSRSITQGWVTAAAALENLDDEEASAEAYQRALAGVGL
ncbi:helix-turn-helix transcriptional regulator [Thermopolyspora sp. NPDC052614]|uniref:helix-turn-helix domain-containing protein n=1 Tax=Thermopolyspora sp. NPDC052614 TaxID=3155682 RepID=UPI00343518B6